MLPDKLTPDEALALMGKKARINQGLCEGDIVVMTRYIGGQIVITVEWLDDPPSGMMAGVVWAASRGRDGAPALDVEPVQVPLAWLDPMP